MSRQFKKTSTGSTPHLTPHFKFEHLPDELQEKIYSHLPRKKSRVSSAFKHLPHKTDCIQEIPDVTMNKQPNKRGCSFARKFEPFKSTLRAEMLRVFDTGRLMLDGDEDWCVFLENPQILKCLQKAVRTVYVLYAIPIHKHWMLNILKPKVVIYAYNIYGPRVIFESCEMVYLPPDEMRTRSYSDRLLQRVFQLSKLTTLFVPEEDYLENNIQKLKKFNTRNVQIHACRFSQHLHHPPHQTHEWYLEWSGNRIFI